MLHFLRRRRAIITVFPLLLVLMFVFSGCVVVIGGRGHTDWDRGWEGEIQYDSNMVERYTFDVPRGAAVSVSAEVGSISITRADIDHATVVARFNARSDERLDDSSVVSVTQEDGTIDIHPAWAKNTRKHGESCDLEITLPNTSSLVVRTRLGAIDVEGFEGIVDVQTQDGQIQLYNLAGPVIASTGNGQIILHQMPGSAAPVTLNTHRGSIRASLSTSFQGSLSIETQRGHITLNDAETLQYPTAIETLSDDVIRLSVGTSPDESSIFTRRGSVLVTFTD